MTVQKTQLNQRLENWASKYNIQDFIQNKDIFVHVDKYNKPINKSYLIKKDAFFSLPKEQQLQLENLKKQLPYEELYFKVKYNQQNNLFFVFHKTPIQSMLNIWAIVLIIWALYRGYFQTSLPIWADEFFIKPLVFFIPVYYYIVKIEKNNFLDGVDLNKKVFKSDLLIGLFVGVFFFIAGGLGYFFKNSSFSLESLFASPGSLIVFAAVAVATSVSEEMLSRGFMLKRLYQDSKNIYSSALFTSVLFFFLHIPILFTNQNFFGPLLLQVMVTDFLLSMAVSFLYIQSGSLLLPILVHALYNFSLYVFSNHNK